MTCNLCIRTTCAHTPETEIKVKKKRIPGNLTDVQNIIAYPAFGFCAENIMPLLESTNRSHENKN